MFNLSNSETLKFKWANTKKASILNLLSRFFFFRAHIFLEIETPHYKMRTANNLLDLFFALRLRFLCFTKELKRFHFIPLDVDKFDWLADHLLIYSKDNGQLVGTYRLLSSLFTENFYSETEFDLKQLRKNSRHLLELGRACTHPEFRGHNLVDLLWKGIASYAAETKATHLFGCTSIKTLDHQKGQNLLQYFKDKGFHSDDYNIQSFFPLNITTANSLDISDAVPPLLKAYMLAGAKVYGGPFVDLEFKCMDFLTILHLNHVTPSFKRRYFSC
jgi:putative hemolysin